MDFNRLILLAFLLGGIAFGLGRWSAGSHYSEGGNVSGQTMAVYVVGEVKQPGVVTLPLGARVVHAIKKAGGLTQKADPLAINLAAKLHDEQMVVVPARGKVVAVRPVNSGNTPVGIGSEPIQHPTPGVTPSGIDASPPPPPPEDEEQEEHWGGGVVVDDGEDNGADSNADSKVGPQRMAVHKVSINRATVEELQAVPGIGPQLAVAIVAYRQGPPKRAFSTLEDLMKVPGIKRKKLEQIRPYIDL